VTGQEVKRQVLGNPLKKNLHKLWIKLGEKNMLSGALADGFLTRPDFGLGEKCEPDMGGPKPNN
jgi:hypothetical protein